MTVNDYKNIFEELNPIVVKYNGEVIFDDDNIDLSEEEFRESEKRLDEFMHSNKVVKSFKATVVHFHHTILEIEG